MKAELPSVALDEFEAKRLLAAYGVPVVGEQRVRDVDAAIAAAWRLGFPVVLKACGAEFAHKSDLGLVKLNLADPAALQRAADELQRATDGRGELLVQPMVSGRREFMAGMARDPQFGPVVTFGLGGIFAEALDDVTLRIAPLGFDDARSMLGEIRARALLGPLRGLPAVDSDALARILVALSRLALERPDIVAVDINPIIVSGTAPVAVDALVLLAAP